MSGIAASIDPAVQLHNETYILCSDDTHTTYYDVVWFVEPTSSIYLLSMVCASCSRMQPIITLPFPLVRAIVKYGKYLLNSRNDCPLHHAHMLVFFPKPFMFHEESIDELVVSRRYSNAKAKAYLGWEYVIAFVRILIKNKTKDSLEGRNTRHCGSLLQRRTTDAVAVLSFRWYPNSALGLVFAVKPIKTC